MNFEVTPITAIHPEYGIVQEVLNYTQPRTKYTKNEIRIYDSGVCEIDVYDIDGYKKNTAIFSIEDLDAIKEHKWYEDNVGYLSTTIDGKKVRLHKFLFPNQITDHYDNNKLNNLRENLKPITQDENVAKIYKKMDNKTGVTGLYETPSSTWCAAIEVKGKRKTKNFNSKEEAILMRYIWELNNWGINAPQLRDIKEKYPRLVNAMASGYKIAENPKTVLAILQRLEVDEHCPCRRVKNEDTKCMCKEFREGGLGECHCGLYEKTEI